MTGSGVERMPRMAYPLPFPPAGASSPLPPHIQGAERRMERPARRTGIRWGLRVLVVGGLAGAAWLLTGSAAYAADRVDGPDGSLLGSLVDGEATSPVTGLLQAAVQPLEDVEPAHEHHAAFGVVDVPRRVLTRPMDVFDEVTDGVTGTTVDAALGDVDRVLRDVAAPFRLNGGPAGVQNRLTVVTDTVTATERPAPERPLQPASEPVAAPSADPPVVTASRAPSTDRLTPAGDLRVVPVERRTVTSGPSAHRHHRALPKWKAHGKPRRAAHAVSAVPATVQEESTPGGDTPAAPVRLHLGEVSGIPAGGPGTVTDGGSAAVLPAAITNSTTARHRLVMPSDVEVRRHDAEAPTVSPD